MLEFGAFGHAREPMGSYEDVHVRKNRRDGQQDRRCGQTTAQQKPKTTGKIAKFEA